MNKEINENKNRDEKIQSEQEFNIFQKSLTIKRQQWRNATTILLLGIFVSYLLYSFIAMSPGKTTDIEWQTKEKIDFASSINPLNTKLLLIDRIQYSLRNTKKDNLAISEDIERLKKQEQFHQNKLQKIKDRINNLEQQIEELQTMLDDNSEESCRALKAFFT